YLSAISRRQASAHVRPLSPDLHGVQREVDRAGADQVSCRTAPHRTDIITRRRSPLHFIDQNAVALPESHESNCPLGPPRFGRASIDPAPCVFYRAPGRMH
ncbi:unnamed protein product, partial [Laminaria digitata]